MLQLNTIKAQPGSVRKNKRLGRGHGSGHGQTSGKGDKGQKARKSGQVRAGFEGGQTPLFRRLPKRGFTNNLRSETAILNLVTLETMDPKSLPEVSLESLEKAGVIRGAYDRLAVLGVGDVTKAFQIKAHKVSQSALEKIKKAGGNVEIVKFPKLIRKKASKKTKS